MNHNKLISFFVTVFLVLTLLVFYSPLVKNIAKEEGVSLQELEQSLTIAAEAKQASKTLNLRTEWLSIEDSTKILFTSLDKGNESKWLHQNLIIRDANAVQRPASQNLYNYNNINPQNILSEEVDNILIED